MPATSDHVCHISIYSNRRATKKKIKREWIAQNLWLLCNSSPEEGKNGTIFDSFGSQSRWAWPIYAETWNDGVNNAFYNSIHWLVEGRDRWIQFSSHSPARWYFIIFLHTIKTLNLYVPSSLHLSCTRNNTYSIQS